MDVSEVLETAYKSVVDSGIPDHLHEVAFREAVRIMVGGQASEGVVDATTPTTPATSSRADAPSSSSGVSADALSEDQFFTKFAQEANVAEDKLRDLYKFNDGQVVLNVQRRKLGTAEAEKNRNAALLYAAAHWYPLGKQSVPLSEVRRAASSLGYEVSRNFAKQMDTVKGIYTIGQNQNKAVKVRPDEMDQAFTSLMEELTQ